MSEYGPNNCRLSSGRTTIIDTCIHDVDKRAACVRCENSELKAKIAALESAPEIEDAPTQYPVGTVVFVPDGYRNPRLNEWYEADKDEIIQCHRDAFPFDCQVYRRIEITAPEPAKTVREKLEDLRQANVGVPSLTKDVSNLLADAIDRIDARLDAIEKGARRD